MMRRFNFIILISLLIVTNKAKAGLGGEFSTCKSQPEHILISEIEITDKYTRIDCIMDIRNVGYITISPDTYIIDGHNHKHKIVAASDITFSPNAKTFTEKERETGLYFFSLYFEPNIQIFGEWSIKEETPNGWEWTGIKLNWFLYLKKVFIFNTTKQEDGNYKSISSNIKHDNVSKFFEVTGVATSKNTTTIMITFKNDNINRYLSLNTEIYLLEHSFGRDKKKKLVNIVGLPLEPQKKPIQPNEQFTFFLIFEPLEISYDKFSIIHPETGNLIQKKAKQYSDKIVYFNINNIRAF